MEVKIDAIVERCSSLDAYLDTVVAFIRFYFFMKLYFLYGRKQNKE